MLTDAECRNATCPPDRKQKRYYDTGGLYLQVSPGGSKRWFLKYHQPGGKEKQLPIGHYPKMGLPAARKARDEAKAQKASGVDPVQARQVKKLKDAIGSDDTLEAVARDWLKRNRPNWSATHDERETRNIEKDLLPWLGRRKISDIEPVELLHVIEKVAERGALSVVERVHLTARGIWCHAVATGRAPRDITADIKKALPRHLKKNFPAIVEPGELAELLRASDGHKGGPIVRAALKLAPILFQRPGNLRTMRWADLNLDRALWSIPSEDMKRTKAAKINGQPHVCPLPRQAVELLRELHHLTGGGEWVFPGIRDSKTPMSEAGVSAALNAMGYKGKHTWHGYRATGRTILRQVLKYPSDVIEAQLAHRGQITHGGAYDRATHLEERAEMIQRWADYLDKLRTGAEVIPLHRAA